MFKKQWLVGIALTVALASLVILACKSDSPTGPNNNTGGTGSTVPAGVYKLTLSQWTCGMMDTMTVSIDQVMCSAFSFDELFELACPVTVTNNSFTVNCTTQQDDGSCSYTEQIQATGTLTGSTWTVDGTVNITNETPPGCSGEPACASVHVVLEQISSSPTACSYAPPNTVAASIVGGPLAGSTEFQTVGSASVNGNLYSWGLFGTAGTFAAKRPGDQIENIANLNLNLTDIDSTNLPQTFEVTVVGGGVQAPAMASGTASYYDQSTSGTYFYAVDGSGSVTVNEVDGDHIAGRINSLSINGQEYIPGGVPSSATRSLSGGFFVQQSAPVKPQGEAGWLGRMLTHLGN